MKHFDFLPGETQILFDGFTLQWESDPQDWISVMNEQGATIAFFPDVEKAKEYVRWRNVQKEQEAPSSPNG